MLQLLPWCAMEFKSQAKLAGNASSAGPFLTPLSYAIELRQQSWVQDILKQARIQFQTEVRSKLDVEGTASPTSVVGKPAATSAWALNRMAESAQHKFQNWLDADDGTGRTPLYRSAEMQKCMTTCCHGQTRQPEAYQVSALCPRASHKDLPGSIVQLMLDMFLRNVAGLWSWHSGMLHWC